MATAKRRRKTTAKKATSSISITFKKRLQAAAKRVKDTQKDLKHKLAKTKLEMQKKITKVKIEAHKAGYDKAFKEFMRYVQKHNVMREKAMLSTKTKLEKQFERVLGKKVSSKKKTSAKRRTTSRKTITRKPVRAKRRSRPTAKRRRVA